MFTVFHTADWHLGQSFFGFDRNFEHSQFLSWLLNALEEHQPDALVISGDVFDNINPSAVSTRLFYGFLADTRRSLPDLHIVITAGNHDSGNRLEAPAELLKSLNITVVGTVVRQSDGSVDAERFVVSLKDKSDQLQAVVIAVPFLRPAEVPRVPDANDAYLDGIKELYEVAAKAALKRRGTANVPIIALGHCHVQGGIESRDSERRLVIGGAEALSPRVFPETLDYIALGHLHKAQHFLDGKVRYSGSPIPLSFAERDYEHRVLKVQFEAGRLDAVEDLHVPNTLPLLTVPQEGTASLDDVLQQLEAMSWTKDLPQEQQPLLEVRILDDGPDPLRRRKVEDALTDKAVRLVSIKLESPVKSDSANSEEAALSLSDLQSIDPEKVFVSAYNQRYDGEPSDDVLKAFREIVSQETASR